MLQTQFVLQGHVVDLSAKGSGLVKHPDYGTIFIPWTLPGDEITFEITENTGRYSFGKLLQITKPSALRLTPPCAVFGTCGGCQWQHIPYPLQWETKLKGIQTACTRVGIQLPPVAIESFPAAAHQTYGYRNRIQMRGIKETLGFYAPGTHHIVPTHECKIATPNINAVLPDIAQQGRLRKKPYKVEIQSTGDPTDSNLVEVFWNQSHAAGGFRQVNDAQNAQLQQWIYQKFENLTQTPAFKPGLLDLFGGNGNLSTPVASLFSQVHCVDLHINPPSNKGSTVFHNQDVTTFLKAFPTPTMGREFFAIIDPPRIGLYKSVKMIGQEFDRLGVKNLILVGCDVDSWARDLCAFHKIGFQVTQAAGFDFFPQTIHLESAALLQKLPRAPFLATGKATV